MEDQEKNLSIEENRISLGKKIKNKRIANDKTIDEMAIELRVEFEKIESIEDGVILDNSNPYINRILCKTYMEKLGVKEEIIKIEIEKSYPNLLESNNKTIDLSEDIGDTIFVEGVPKKKSLNNLKRLGYALIVFILVVMIFISTYLLYKNIVDIDEEVINTTTLIQDTILIPENIVEKTFTDKIEYIGLDGKYIDFEITGLEDENIYTITIKATGDTYIEVYDYTTGLYIEDGGIMLYDGDELEIEVDKIDQVVINAGAIQNTEVYINDIKLEIEEEELSGQYFIRIKDSSGDEG